MHVLVVDDDPEFRELIRRMLEPFHAVREAQQGLEALRSMENDRPTLVLLDMSLSDVDGVHVLPSVGLAQRATFQRP